MLYVVWQIWKHEVEFSVLFEQFPQILRNVHNYNIYKVQMVFRNNFSKRPKTYV